MKVTGETKHIDKKHFLHRIRFHTHISYSTRSSIMSYHEQPVIKRADTSLLIARQPSQPWFSMISHMPRMTSRSCINPLPVFLTYCILPSKQWKKSTHSACMRIKYLRSKLMGKHKQKNRAEQTRIHTFVAKIFYSLSSSICTNWLVLSNTLQTALRSEVTLSQWIY